MRIDNMTPVNIGKTLENLQESSVAPGGKERVDALPGNEQKQLEEAVKQANKALEGTSRHFKYEVHEPTNRIIISVIDDVTNEVVKEIPPKNLLDMVAKFMELAGIIVDERR